MIGILEWREVFRKFHLAVQLSGDVGGGLDSIFRSISSDNDVKVGISASESVWLGLVGSYIGSDVKSSSSNFSYYWQLYSAVVGIY